MEEYCEYCSQTTDEKHNMSPDCLYGAIGVSRRCLQPGDVNTVFFAKNIHRSLLDRSRVHAACTRSARRQRRKCSSAVFNQQLFNRSTSNIFLFPMRCSLGICLHKQLSVSFSEVACTPQIPGAWKHKQLSRFLADLVQAHRNPLLSTTWCQRRCFGSN